MSGAQGRRFRPNVCAVLTDADGVRVLVFRRVDAARGPHRWQFPQGGLEPGESPEAGLYRELHEEIGTAAVDVLRQSAEPVRYVYPPDVQAALAARDPEKGAYHGQAQHWFLARLREGTGAIRFDRHDPPEFDAFQWVTPAEAVTLVVPFKRDAYRRGLAALGLLPAPAP